MIIFILILVFQGTKSKTRTTSSKHPKRNRNKEKKQHSHTNQNNKLKAKDCPDNCPIREKIIKFNKEVKGYFKKINQNKLQIRTLEKLRDTLLPKLMSGEVRIKGV